MASLVSSPLPARAYPLDLLEACAGIPTGMTVSVIGRLPLTHLPRVPRLAD